MKSFALSPEGTLYLADGFSPVKKWKGLSSSVSEAGVTAAANKLTLAGSGSGDIVGPIYGYYRFLDVDGNPGNVSPVSLEFDSSASNGTISNATNASPIRITSAAHGLATNDIVKIEDCLGNLGANGRWKVTVIDVDTFDLYERTGSAPSVGTGVYKGGGSWYEGYGTLTYGNLPTSYPDSRAVTIQILRTKPGDATVVYVDYESSTLPGATHASTKTDDDLGEGVALTDLADKDLAISYYTEPPAYKSFLTSANGRMVAVGDPIYSTGIVKVTNGSASVTGYNTNWTSELEGRYLWVEGGDKPYYVETVGGTGSITLDENYAGTSNAFAKYGIRPEEGERRTLHYAQAGLAEAWNPLDNALTLIEDVQAGEITAAFAHGRWVYVFAEDRIWRVSYQNDPADDGYSAFGPQRGAINNRCVCVVDDEIYALDSRGAYAFSGNDFRPVSRAIQNIFDPESDSHYKVQWRWRRYFHIAHDPESETVMFFVSLTGGPPRHVLAYRYRSEKWDILEYSRPLYSSCLGRSGGRRQVYCGGPWLVLLGLNIGHQDGGPLHGTTRGTVTSAGLLSLTDSSASFSSLCEGRVINIVEGKGAGQWRRILTSDGTTLRLNQAWASVPDTTSVYQIAGVNWLWRSGQFKWDRSDVQQYRSLELELDPRENDSTFRAKIFRDRSDTPEVFERTLASDDNDGVAVTAGESTLLLDTTKSNGFLKHRLDGSSDSNADGERLVQIELSGVTNGFEPHKIFEIGIEGAQ